MVLSHVIEKIQAGSTSVPFRDSKLTFLLRNSLIGNSKTLAIVCCSPIESHHHETLCSLRFAEKVNKVELNKTVAKFSCRVQKTSSKPQEPKPNRNITIT